MVRVGMEEEGSGRGCAWPAASDCYYGRRNGWTLEMIGETEGRDGREARGDEGGRRKEAWKTNEQEPQRELLLVGAGNEAGSLARSLVPLSAAVPPSVPRSPSVDPARARARTASACMPRQLHGLHNAAQAVSLTHNSNNHYNE